MKKINLFLTILAAAAGFTNCSKAELVENKETGNGGSVVYATTDAATKTTLANDYKVLWSEGDQIKFIKSDAPATTYTYTLSSGAGTTSGTFTCAQTPVDGTYTVWYNYYSDEKYWYRQDYVNAADISEAPMKATATVSDGKVSDISFKNEGGILRYTVKGSKTIKSIKVKSASGALNLTLDCGDGVALTEGGTVFNIVVKPGTYSDVTLTFSATDFTLATKKANSFVVKKNTVSLATFEAADLLFLPAGALKGVFTVSDPDSTPNSGDEKKVYFSQGNLWADIDKALHFEANQYSSASSWDAFHVSHFTWSSKVEDAANNCASGDYLFCDESHKVSVDGGEAIYYALSKEEWEYLINTRKMTNSKARYSNAVSSSGITIGGTAYNGVFLYPDNYNGDVVGDGSMTWTWDAINAAGIVFLPAAGYCEFNQVHSGSEGFYWSSSAYTSGSTGSYFMFFYSEAVEPGRGNNDGWGDRQKNYSVRLVTEVK